MTNKPNDFKSKALSHIPQELYESMIQTATIKPSDLEALDKVVKIEGPKIRSSIPGINQIPQQAPTAQSPVPTQPSSISYAIEGHVINVPTNEIGAAITLFYTLLSLVWGKDKKVAKILKQIDFKFLDANNVQLYPKKGKKK